MRILRPATSVLVGVATVAAAVVALATPAGAVGLGVLDTSWGANGRVTIAFNTGGDDEATAVASQPDGDVVVAGKSYDGTTYPHMALARLTPTGAPDTSFGGTGTGRVVVPTFGLPTGTGTNGDVANAVAVQGDGKILVAGSASDAAGDGALAVARYNADGSPDLGFGTAGTGQVTVQVGTNGLDDTVNGLALQPDGSIVLAGSWSGGWAVARLTATGVLDTTFDAAGAQPGVQAFDLGDPLADNADAVAIQPLGASSFGIVVAGAGAHGLGGAGAFNEDFALVRFTSAGLFDPAFGTGGIRKFNAGSQDDVATSLAIQPDGAVVVAGRGVSNAVTVARFGANGALDSTFGTAGKTALPVTAEEASPQTGLAVAGDGSILVGGTARSGADDVLVGRLTSTGALDTTFGSSGTTTTNVGAYGSIDRTAAIAIDSVGRLDVVGSTSASGASRWFATRYTTAATAPTIVTKPVAATSCGTPVSYSVVASGQAPLQYGWQVQGALGGPWITLSDSSTISGTSTSTLTIQPGTIAPSDNGDHLRALVSNAGGTVYSPGAILHVGTKPVVTLAPVNTTPNTDGTVAFSAGASGSPAPTVQWYVKPVGGTYAAITGATSTTYSFISNGTEFGNQYRARFTNFCGSVTTTSGTLLASP